jgi:hypothetical protein
MLLLYDILIESRKMMLPEGRTKDLSYPFARGYAHPQRRIKAISEFTASPDIARPGGLPLQGIPERCGAHAAASA